MIEADVEFLKAFEDCTLRKTCWNHTSHLRMAYLQLEAHRTFEGALNKIRDSIKKYNAVVGSKGYHETVTVAFTKLIHYRRLLGERTSDWRLFLERNPDLLSTTLPVLGKYYSRELLMSAEARERSLEPDKKTLPAAGELRLASDDDAEAILEIYKPYVEETSISFELVPPTISEMRKRISKYSELAPWLVYVVDGEVAGYAYGSRHREREAYAWSIDVFAYVSAKFHRTGIGRLLYTNLLRLLIRQGFYNAFAGITLPNDASVGLHEDLGFRPLGIYRNVGHNSGAGMM